MAGFGGLRVAAFESRRAADMERLITRYGGQPLVTPALREIPLEDNHEALAVGDALLSGQIDIVILLTGVGTRTWVEVLRTRHSPSMITAALGKTTLVARGPKPVAALKELGLTPRITVPEPNTWRDLLAALDQTGPLTGLRIAVQEYGVPNQDLLEALRTRGATVTRVPVYRWALPEDTASLRGVLDAILSDQVDVMLITSAVQIDHLVQVLRRPDDLARLRQATSRMIVASIGPVASERLLHYGLPVDLEPSHPKMGILVKEAAEQAADLLRSKRQGGT